MFIFDHGRRYALPVKQRQGGRFAFRCQRAHRPQGLAARQAKRGKGIGARQTLQCRHANGGACRAIGDAVKRPALMTRRDQCLGIGFQQTADLVEAEPQGDGLTGIFQISLSI